MSILKPRYAIVKSGEKSVWRRMDETDAITIANHLAEESGEIYYVWKKQKARATLVYKTGDL